METVPWRVAKRQPVGPPNESCQLIRGLSAGGGRETTGHRADFRDPFHSDRKIRDRNLS